jgi:hypothetical protein
VSRREEGSIIEEEWPMEGWRDGGMEGSRDRGIEEKSSWKVGEPGRADRR